MEQPAKRRKLSHGDDEQDEIHIDVGASSAPELQSKTQSNSIPGNANTAAVNDNNVSTTTASTKQDDAYAKSMRPKPISKNQMKKLRKKAEWEAGKESRRMIRKEKNQERKLRRREQAQQEREKRIAQGLDPTPPVTQPYRRPDLLPITFIVDCGFDDKMFEKERISLGSQLTRSYSDNSKAPFQGHLVISSWNGLLKERFDTILRKTHENWKGVVFTEDNFVVAAQRAEETMKGPDGGKLAGIFSRYASAEQPRSEQLGGSDQETVEPNLESVESVAHSVSASNGTAAHEEESASSTLLQDSIAGPASVDPKTLAETIYLTSDSPYTLDTLSPYSTYIIGGLVDKNRHKGICYRTASDAGVKTAKLPIGKFMEMQSRYVLATSHVVEIMVRYLECGDWGEAFMKVIPKRKGGKLKGGKDEQDDGASAGVDNDNGDEQHESGESDDNDDDDDDGNAHDVSVSMSDDASPTVEESEAASEAKTEQS